MFCSYEPELFPGLIYRMIKPRIVLLIFVSGKVVLTGKIPSCLLKKQNISLLCVLNTGGEVGLLVWFSHCLDPCFLNVLMSLPLIVNKINYFDVWAIQKKLRVQELNMELMIHLKLILNWTFCSWENVSRRISAQSNDILTVGETERIWFNSFSSRKW